MGKTLLQSVYGLLPAFRFGIMDSINPYAISTLLIYVVFLLCVKHDRRYFRLSFLFVVFVVLGRILYATGLLHEYLYAPMFFQTSFALNAVVGFLFIMMTFVFIRDWQICRREDGSRNYFFRLTADDASESQMKSPDRLPLKQLVGFCLLSLLLAAFVTICASVWPLDLRFFLHQHILIQGRNFGLASAACVVYAVMYAWPLFFVWLLMKLIKESEVLSRRMSRAEPLWYVFLAGLFLIEGATLIRFYFAL